MKKFLFFLAVTACLVTTGCSDEYDDSVLTERIEALENRMKELEELCKRLNENDYITSVEPVIENRKTVGYELSFGKSDPITIYHGKDGADSAITEVTQDEQNVYLTLQDGTVITLPKKESSGGSGDGDNSGEGSDSGDDGDNGDGGEEADPTKASVEVPKAGAGYSTSSMACFSHLLSALSEKVFSTCSMMAAICLGSRFCSVAGTAAVRL